MSSRKPPLNPFTLRFHDEALEAAYREDYTATSLPIVRVTLILGALLYAAYGYLDRLLVPDEAPAVWAVRFPIVLLILLVFSLTYVEALRRHLNALFAMLIVLAGLDVTIMMGRWADELGHLYVSGLLMVFMFAHGHLRMRFVYATASTMLVVAVYAATVPMRSLIETGSILGGASLLCMFASYAIEFFDRKSFWHTMMLNEKRRQLELEHTRKSQQLDAARRLQFSLLPQDVPTSGPVDIAVAMRPALEIGGDYYDFDAEEDGRTITFAIGDATGHGAEAGAMVTATKILFASLSREERIADILTRATATLKRVGISKLYMALAVGRIRGGELQLAGAGMPPAIIFRAATGRCELVPLKGMPLGSFADFPYATSRTRLDPGDTVVLMSDGFPEAFNPDGEMLGYERAIQIVRSESALEPADLIASLMDHARAWCGDAPIADDITFMVLRSTPTTGNDRRHRLDGTRRLVRESARRLVAPLPV